jgi:hypothetical protein
VTDLTAETVLKRFNYESTAFDPDSDTPIQATSYANVEYIIDDVIDYINLEAGTSISNLAGVAGEKTVTVTNAQNAVIKMLLSLMLRDAKYKISSSGGLGPANTAETVSQQPLAVQKMFEKALDRLRGRNFVRV